jgi:hypothetical protein
VNAWLLFVLVIAISALVAVGSILLANRLVPAPFQHSLEVFDAVDSGK